MKKTKDSSSKTKTTKKTCGIIMTDLDLPADQWKDVKQILEDVAKEAGFEPHLVNEEFEMIRHEMVQNSRDNNEIIICDVSGRDPNVMFQLGMCLALNKPTIVIKNDKTDYSFVSDGLKYLKYPKDLRFNKIVEFKEKLKEQLKDAHKLDQQSDNYAHWIFKHRRKIPGKPPKHSTKECREMVKRYIDMFSLYDNDKNEFCDMPLASGRDMLMDYLKMSLVGIMFEDRDDLEVMVNEIIGKPEKLEK